MVKQSDRYLANTGIDFEEFKPPVRVEANEPIPSRVDPDEIKDLLETGLIRESEVKK
jgi:hypothetical protein